MQEQIVVSAVVLRNTEGHILTVRKRGTRLFMFPGGKLDAGETPAEAATRECAEELGVALTPQDVHFLGEFITAAAHEHGYDVRAFVFSHPSIEVTEPHAEIEELAWVDLHHPQVPLAPLLDEAVFPFLRETTESGHLQVPGVPSVPLPLPSSPQQ